MKPTFAIIRLIAIVFLLFTQSCNENNACFSPPRDFQFRFVDQPTSENLIANGSISKDQITVIDNYTGLPVPFNFVKEANEGFVRVGGIFSGAISYSFNVEDEKCLYFQGEPK